MQLREVKAACHKQVFLCLADPGIHLEEGHRPYRLSWDRKVVVTGFCHSRVPSKGGTEVHCHSGDSFLSVSLMLLLGSCIFTKIPALLDCGYIPTLPLLRCFT